MGARSWPLTGFGRYSVPRGVFGTCSVVFARARTRTRTNPDPSPCSVVESGRPRAFGPDGTAIFDDGAFHVKQPRSPTRELRGPVARPDRPALAGEGLDRTCGSKALEAETSPTQSCRNDENASRSRPSNPTLRAVRICQPTMRGDRRHARASRGDPARREEPFSAHSALLSRREPPGTGGRPRRTRRSDEDGPGRPQVHNSARARLLKCPGSARRPGMCRSDPNPPSRGPMGRALGEEPEEPGGARRRDAWALHASQQRAKLPTQSV